MAFCISLMWSCALRRYARLDERTAGFRLAATCAAVVDGRHRDDGIVWMLLPRWISGTLECARSRCCRYFWSCRCCRRKGRSSSRCSTSVRELPLSRRRIARVAFRCRAPHGPQIDSGNRIIVPYLRASGVRTLTGMMVTHGDNDHSGGANSWCRPWRRMAADVVGRRPRAKLRWRCPRAAVRRAGVGIGTGWTSSCCTRPRELPRREKFRGNDRSCVHENQH